MTYAETVAAAAAADAAYTDLDALRAEAWTAVLDARAAVAALSRAAAEACDPAVYRAVGGRRWTTDGVCAISEGWPMPDDDPERPWRAPSEALEEVLRAPQAAPEEGRVFGRRMAPTLRAGQVVGLLSGPHPVGVLDVAGAIRAVVAPLQRGASPAGNVWADGSPADSPADEHGTIFCDTFRAADIVPGSER